jgi:membrane protein DedA with SNARE-associated domain
MGRATLAPVLLIAWAMDGLAREIAQHGLRIVFSNVLLQQAGVPIPAEPTLIVAGSLVARHVLSGPAVMLVTLSAIVIADTTWFMLGRFYGARVMRLVARVFRRSDASARKTELAFARWGMKSLTVAKFLPGVSQVLLPMAGAMGARFRTVLFYDLIGGVIWAAAAIGAGAFFHREVEAFLAAPLPTAVWLAGGAAIAAAIFAFWVWKRRPPARATAASAAASLAPAASLAERSGTGSGNRSFGHVSLASHAAGADRAPGAGARHA